VFGAGQPGDQSDEKGTEDGDSSAGSSGQASTTNTQTATNINPTTKLKTTTKIKPTKRVIAIGVVAAAVAAGGLTYAATQHSGPSSSAAAGLRAATGLLRVNSVTPVSQETGVDGAAPIVVTFSVPVAANSPDPQLTPAVAGTWSTEGNSMVFTPTQAYGPSQHVTLQIPAGPTGVRSATGGRLAAAFAEHFTTGTYAQAGLAELLAELGYLPLTWSPEQSGAIRAAAAMGVSDAASPSPQGQAFDPPAGTFQWNAGYPSVLEQMWSPDQANALLRGAVMAFESQHNMTIDGSLTPRLWKALFQAEATGDRNLDGYTYAIANKGSPETLTVWHDGREVMRSLANTGIPSEPTVNGTFPVYLRFRFTIMSGTNPDGSHYSDPVQFVSYFNGGDAVHYFPRGGYGYQQSLGCVELPYNAAQQAFPYLTYGSLVTVTG